MCVCVCVCVRTSGVLAVEAVRDRRQTWTLAHLAEGPGHPSSRPGDVGLSHELVPGGQ